MDLFAKLVNGFTQFETIPKLHNNGHDETEFIYRGKFFLEQQALKNYQTIAEKEFPEANI